MPGYAPLILAAASAALSYLVCIRPMRRGGCHTVRGGRRGAAVDSVGEQLELARAELELLRLQQTAKPHRSGAPEAL